MDNEAIYFWMIFGGACMGYAFGLFQRWITNKLFPPKAKEVENE